MHKWEKLWLALVVEIRCNGMWSMIGRCVDYSLLQFDVVRMCDDVKLCQGFWREESLWPASVTDEAASAGVKTRPAGVGFPQRANDLVGSTQEPKTQSWKQRGAGFNGRGQTGVLTASNMVTTSGYPPFPQIDIIGAVVIVWRVRGKTIRSVLCNIVCNNWAQCDARTYEQN